MDDCRRRLHPYGFKQTAQAQEKTEMSMLWDQQVRSKVNNHDNKTREI